MAVTRVEEIYEAGSVGNVLLGDFLRRNLIYRSGQQAPFDEGFNSLRRRQFFELLEIRDIWVTVPKIGQGEGFEINPDLPKYALVALFDAWVLQGRLKLEDQIRQVSGEPVYEGFEKMPWPMLMSIAVNAGIKTHGLKRTALIEALEATESAAREA